MKKVILACITLTVAVSTAFAADFSPTLLKLSADKSILYQFDGSELSIPLTVSGTPATVLFCVFTKGQAENIGPVRNGYLGGILSIKLILVSMYLTSSRSE